MAAISTYLIAFCTLYVPGFLIARAAGLKGASSFILAPLFSFACYMAVPALLDGLSVPASWLIVFAISVALGSVLLLGRFVLKRTGHELASFRLFGEEDRRGLWVLVLYILIASVFMLCVFCQGFGSPDSFNQQFDNYTHLSLVQTYLQMDQFSPLHTMYYESATPFYGQYATTYPPLWHIACALIASGAHCEPTVASNVLNYVICAVVFPSGVFLLLKVILEERRMVIAGAFIATAFTAFPAGFIDWGPLSPNLLSYALFPYFVSLFILAASTQRARSERALLWTMAFIALMLTVFSQPNTVFVIGIFLVPFICYQIIKSSRFNAYGLRKRKLIKIALVVGVVVLAAAAWIFFYLASFMQATVSHEWAVFSTRKEALFGVVTLGMTERVSSQPLLGAIVLVGLVYAFWQPSYRWIAFPYLFACCLYIGGIPSDGFLRHFLTGFWFTDPYRVAAMIALFAIPLAALGLYAISSIISRICRRIGQSASRGISSVVSAVLAIAFLLYCYYPIYLPRTEGPNTAFGSLVDDIRKQSALYYTIEEEGFIEEVKAAVGEDALVLNDPYDGSAYLYGAEGLTVSFPYYLKYQTDEASTLASDVRHHLKEYASRDELLQTLREANAKYLLLLDVPQEGSDLSREWNASDPQLYEEMLREGSIRGWEGLYGIDESTPGFRLLLSEGDMRLYELTEI